MFCGSLRLLMQTPPHIAYLYSRYPVVSQTFCDTEMLALEAMGFQITVGSLNPPTTSFRHERLDRLRAEIIYPPPSPVLEAHPVNDPLWLEMNALAEEHDKRYGKAYKSATRARNAFYFAKELNQRGIKHVHVHFANRATHTALFLKKAGISFSFTAHAQDLMIDLGSTELLQEMAREAEFVVAVSDFSKGLLQSMCPESSGKIIRIYNGLDPAAFRPTCAPAGPLKIVSIGRLIDFKGFQHLIPAIALLRDRGIIVSLKIVGDGPLRNALEKQINSLNINELVSLLGIQSQDQIKHLMEQSDVFALGCIVDAKGASDILPTVILEAMACGKPVVSTKLVGVPEMVEHGISGLLAEPGNEAQLADHLATLAHDPAMRAAMGQAARAKFESTFALEHTAGQLAGQFRKIPSPAIQNKGTPILCLLPDWPVNAWTLAAAEIEFLRKQKSIRLVSPTCLPKLDSPPDGILFLPDAMVLESAWRNTPNLVAKAESIYEKCGSVDGETFFREARRAVYLIGQLSRWQVKHIHAFRAESMLCAWIINRLTGIHASATIQEKPDVSRSSIETMGKDFIFGSLSDSKIKLDWPDALNLHEPQPKRGLFKTAPPAPINDAPKVWSEWMKRVL